MWFDKKKKSVVFAVRRTAKAGGALGGGFPSGQRRGPWFALQLLSIGGRTVAQGAAAVEIIRPKKKKKKVRAHGRLALVLRCALDRNGLAHDNRRAVGGPKGADGRGGRRRFAIGKRV